MKSQYRLATHERYLYDVRDVVIARARARGRSPPSRATRQPSVLPTRSCHNLVSYDLGLIDARLRIPLTADRRIA
jgi:hypothetical protein